MQIKKIIIKIIYYLGYQIIPKEFFLKLTTKQDELLKYSQDLEKELIKFKPIQDFSYLLRDEYKKPFLSMNAIQKLIDDFDFKTVLDIGAGSFAHSVIFAENGKKVTAVDYGQSIYFNDSKKQSLDSIKTIIGDFNKIEFPEQYDCIWASHVLEHQADIDSFLKKIVSIVKTNGIIAITVPHLKHEIVGGHVSLWNSGLLLYRLVLAGLDCSSASILSYGYNISVIVRKRTIAELNIEYDCGDIRRIKQYLPSQLEFNSNLSDDPFNGNISRLNW